MADQANLYSFTVDIGTEAEPKKKIVSVKRPQARLTNRGELFYNQQFTAAVKNEGLAPFTALQKIVLNAGGFLDKERTDKYAELHGTARQLGEKLTELRLIEAPTQAEQEALTETMKQFISVKYSLSEFEDSNADVFGRSAEAYARTRSVLFYIFNCTTVRDEAEGSLEVPLFAGTKFEEQLDAYFKAIDDADPVYAKSIEKLTSVITYWYVTGVSDIEEVRKHVEATSEAS